MRLRACLFATVFGLGAFGVGAQTSTTLSLSDARHIAQASLLQGQPGLTRQLANGLLVANPEDAHALLLLSAAEIELKNPKSARRAAAKAYRVSDTQEQRMQAAQMAANASLAEDLPTLSQIWLRRAATQADSEQETQHIARNYARVRAINPWSVNLAFSVRPSDNVNNGADSAIQVIDGVPLVGFLSRDAQAISGTILSTSIQTRYRVHATDRSDTRLGARLYVQRVLVSDAGDTIDEDDFDATYGEVSVEHAFALGETPGNSAILRATRGTYWSGDDTDYHLSRIDADRIWRLDNGMLFSMGASFAHYERPGDNTQDSQSYILRGKASQKLANGDLLGFGLTYQKTDSDADNRRSGQVSARLTYGFAKKWGPAKARASLNVTNADYPDYAVGFITVPGGREDLSAYADLSLFFEDYDYAGFAPTVTFRAGRTSSNVSRFDTSEFSVNFGFQSKF